MTHNKFTDSLIGGIVSPLSNGPIYFDCYPNFSAYTFDENLGDILKFQIRTAGFDMCQTRTNISIQTRGCFRHTNTLFPPVLHTPRKTSQPSTLVLTDPLNHKMEHQTIRWENISFPTDWIIDMPKSPIPRSITSSQIKESASSTVISFPQKSLSRNNSLVSSSSSTSSFYFHASLHSLANTIGHVPFAVQCLDCGKLVTLSTLSAFKEDEKLQIEHANHNPRTNLPPPPSTAKESCPHPQCYDFPFPREPHVLVVQIHPCTEINKRFQAHIPEDLRKPSTPEIIKFLSLMRGCKKSKVKLDWMKDMLNWDLLTHPDAKAFAKK